MSGVRKPRAGWLSDMPWMEDSITVSCDNGHERRKIVTYRISGEGENVVLDIPQRSHAKHYAVNRDESGTAAPIDENAIPGITMHTPTFLSPTEDILMKVELRCPACRKKVDRKDARAYAAQLLAASQAGLREVPLGAIERGAGG
jgi:hypothetical protein